ncbi:NAD(P)H-dependent oxidoreductase [Roseateles oligotrophus]|uniref:NAD(P)H-dependent oxidoreductase n=1 Tax=Roseateles oligotrophus TaxID=1769250 RepID=A0ABT2YFM1_9BURK|nr:NAD(P)H-dependent oxidoreductase [Roseateles oligotrophus]MCV2368839.1 NAD(P)H-dependent oxidoreductase [Roseateles oligotrophus]
MQAKRILIINGNPKPASFSQALAERYAQAAEQAGHSVQIIHLRDLQFLLSLEQGYQGKQALEPDLLRLQQAILAAEHLVWAYPVWWGSVPALLKGALDRILLPGFAFKYHPGKAIPEKLLKGRTARLLVCMDTPPWYFKWFQGAPAHRMMRQTVLEFCGIKPVRISEFGPVLQSSQARRETWLEQAAKLGAAAG